MSDTTSLAVETSELTKRFGKQIAVSGINLAVATGSIVGVIGPNGAGKTTTMRMLLDIIRPSSGRVRVLGEDPRTGGPSLRRRIGFLPGELRLEGRVTGRAMLEHCERISGPVPSGEIDKLCARLDLDLSRHVRTLSKGNKQKLGIVQAFMHRPELLVLDEPTSGLDPLVQQEFLALMREARGNGQTIVLSSHVLSEIQEAADSVAILRAGRIVTVSDVDSLRLTAIRRVRAGITDSSATEVQAALRALPELDHLEVTENGSLRISATVEGDIDRFVKTIARFHLTDIAIEEPDLEESVLRLYGTEVSDEQH